MKIPKKLLNEKLWPKSWIETKNSISKKENKMKNAKVSRKLAAKKVSTKKIIGKVKSSTNPKVVHVQSVKSGKKVCSCQGFKFQGHCKHLPGVENPNVVIQKAKPVAGKTTRATMINLLLKNKGKVVSITAIKAAIKKLGFSDEKVEKRFKQKLPQVTKWGKLRNLKLVKVGGGFVFKAA